MNHQEAPKRLTHYTSIPSLLHILTTKALTLTNPETWEDKNDAEVMEIYRQQRQVEKVFALCFLTGDETVHHWYHYAEANQGCRLDFEVEPFLASVSQEKGLRGGFVCYKTLEELREGIAAGTIEPGSYPFIKRYAYRCEEEYRIIGEGSREQAVLPFSLAPGVLTGITISDGIPKPIVGSLKRIIAGLFPDIPVHHSSLTRNAHWISAFGK